MDRRSFLSACAALVTSGAIGLDRYKFYKDHPLPVGTIIDTKKGCMILGDEEWLPCDGRNVSRKSYAELFAAIGTYYTDEDERCCTSELFTLPDLRGKLV